MRQSISFLGLFGALAVVHCSSAPALCEGAACGVAGDDGGMPEATTEGGADVAVPPGCDPSAEPKDAPKCVVSDFGVFVDASSGADGNPGTREAPVKSIGAALGKLGGKSRVYVCEGTYAEHVKLTTAVSLYGGFACGAWSYSGTKPKIAPADPGYALEVVDVLSAMGIADVTVAAAPGNAASPSSVAVSVSGSIAVTFTRCEIKAADGFDGKKGANGATGTADKALDGTSGVDATPGASKTCTCSGAGTTSGGSGGGLNSDGANGGPNIPENPVGQVPPRDGKFGIGNTNCGAGGLGHTGADAANANNAMPIAILGSLDASGWTPKGGGDGVSGPPGQGGGGGGGRGGGGGGGACGGGGGGGGAVGGAPNGCGGGDGGKGGSGGAGGGGAGGISAGVLYKGTAPTNDGSTLTPGTKGAKGTGGTPGSNDGPEGQSAETLPVQ